MKMTIRFSQPDELKALPILLRNSAGTVLPDRIYVLEDSAVAALRKAGVAFEELASGGFGPALVEATGCGGALAGERI